MNANRKVILIVILGTGACLLSFFLSQYFSKKNQDNQVLLTQIRQIPGRLEYIGLLSKNFVQNGDHANWGKIIENLKFVDLDLGAAPRINHPWRQEIQDLKTNLEEYKQILTRLHVPAVRLNIEKTRLQSIGLSFSMEVEEFIIKPYRKEEGLQIYKGGPIDPFKARIKETAYDVMNLHLQQQLILLDLLIDWDLPGYRRKKMNIAEALEKHKAQLRYMNVLMGNEPDINKIVDSLDRKLTGLVEQEKVILEHFSTLTKLNDDVTTVGNRLLEASETLSAQIVSDISDANRLNKYLSWGLLIAILGGLSFLGAMIARDIIHFVEELKESREKFKTSENNLKVTLNSLGDAVIATDSTGVITRMNPPAEQLTGWSAAEALGRRLPEVFRIVNAQTRQEAANPVERVLEEGKIVGLANHTVLIARDGKEYQIADSGAPIFNPNRQIIGVVLVFRDVTESYIQEQKIRNNEKRLKDITANVPGVVYQFKADHDHHYSNMFVSEKAYDIFELEPDPVAFFNDFLAQIPEDDKNRFSASVREAVDRFIPWEYEGRFIKPSGEEIWFSGNSVPHRDGDAIVFYGVLMDITRRKQLEESLRLTQFCFDNASIGIFRIGEMGEILTVNEQACHSLGYTSEELCNMTIFDINPVFNSHLWPDHIEKLRKSGRRTIETQHRHKNENVFPVQLVLNLMKFENQEFHVSFVQDITERKKAEEEAKRLETALVQAQKMEAIGALAGGIAHDFNNILSAVIGYTQLSLYETDEDSTLNRNLQRIYTAAMRAADLVHQILTFSRQAERTPQPLQVGPLVKEALKLLRSTLPASIEIRQEIGFRKCSIMADPTQIHQIVMNLCTNAAQSMEENGGVITVVLDEVHFDTDSDKPHQGLMAGDYIKFTVRDTGRGIAPEIMDRIFDPYFTTKASGKGTGLGLSVVHGIVQSYGGCVYAHSNTGNGTTFEVYIPAIEEHSLEERIDKTSLPTGKETILLVDDEPDLVEVSQRILQVLGYKVLACHDSREALDLFKQAPGNIDLVISDVTMPKLTGDELAGRMLRIRPDLPIILSTGYSSKISEPEAKSIGVKALAIKPLIAEKLAALVRKVLDDAGSSV